MDPTQVPLSDTETVLIGLAVSAVVLPTASWRLVEHFNTMAHEGMHGAVGALSGGTVRSITMNEYAEGETRVGFSAGRVHFPYTFLGYLGPSAFGFVTVPLGGFLIFLVLVPAALWCPRGSAPGGARPGSLVHFRKRWQAAGRAGGNRGSDLRSTHG